MVVKTPNYRFERAEVPARVAQKLAGIPWCSSLINDPTLIPLRTLSREPKSSTEDSLVAVTFRTEDTIHTWQTLYCARPDSYPSLNLSEPPIAGTFTILGVGSGLNGHAKLLHGGTAAAIMDEVITFLAARHASPGSADMTAFLKVDYKKPVPTPCYLLARVVLEGRSEGRKQWFKASLEDGNGTVYVTAESLVVEIDRSKL